MKKILSLLLHSNTQAQLFHRQTEVYSQHIALSDYYTAIVPLIDALTEDYEGEFEIITGYQNFKLKDYESLEATISYFETLRTQIRGESVENSNLQNQIDTIITLINSTLYKLKRLSK